MVPVEQSTHCVCLSLVSGQQLVNRMTVDLCSVCLLTLTLSRSSLNVKVIVQSSVFACGCWMKQVMSDDGVAVASAGPYANHLHLAADRWQHQQFSTGWMLFLTPNQQCQSADGCVIPRLHSRLSNRLYNRFDNQLYRVNRHPTSCQTGLTTVLNEQPLFVQPRVEMNSGCSLNHVERTATVRST